MAGRNPIIKAGGEIRATALMTYERITKTNKQ